MKGLIGALSDAFPLLGYHKKYYMVFAALLGTLGAACLAFTPAAVVGGAPAVAASFFFLCHLEISVLDLLCEGKYAVGPPL